MEKTWDDGMKSPNPMDKTRATEQFAYALCHLLRNARRVNGGRLTPAWQASWDSLRCTGGDEPDDTAPGADALPSAAIPSAPPTFEGRLHTAISAAFTEEALAELARVDRRVDLSTVDSPGGARRWLWDSLPGS